MSTKHKTTLGRLRERQGLSQRELADWLGTSQPFISKMEQGRSFISPEHAQRAARVLGVPYKELWELHHREVKEIGMKTALSAIKELTGGTKEGFAHLLASGKGKALVERLVRKSLEDGDNEIAEGLVNLVEKATDTGIVSAVAKERSDEQEAAADEAEASDGGRDSFGRARKQAPKHRDSLGHARKQASEDHRDSFGRSQAETQGTENSREKSEAALKRTTLADLGEDWIVNFVSIVDSPAIPKAKFVVIKERGEIPAAHRAEHKAAIDKILREKRDR